MKSIKVDEKNQNIRIEKYIQTIYPDVPYSVLQKAFRKKDIKVNGKRIDKNYIVKSGDVLDIYINDDLLEGGKGTAGENAKWFTIIYEDENILIVDKKQGIPVHPDGKHTKYTLIDLVREYLRSNAETNGCCCASFQPSLCHRLDRNTGGLVIIAKNQESLDTMLKKIEEHEVKKYYQCLVIGKMEKKDDLLKAYLWKDAGKSRVFVSSHKKKGSLGIITKYKVINYNPQLDISHLEVELMTGRTHQIRAHLAFIEHPVLGDGKYGINSINRMHGIKQQALWAYRLKFEFKESGSMLDYLKGKEFSIEPVFGITL